MIRLSLEVLLSFVQAHLAVWNGRIAPKDGADLASAQVLGLLVSLIIFEMQLVTFHPENRHILDPLLLLIRILEVVAPSHEVSIRIRILK